MKKNIILTVVFLAAITFSANAQFSFGGGATLGTKMGVTDSGGDKIGFGLNARADYALKLFDLSGGLTLFFPSAPEGMSMSAYQLNVDGHYSFLKKETMNVYGLAGLNYSYVKVKGDTDFGGFSISASDSKIGIDLGAGVKFGKMFVEGKYDTAFEQLGLTVGYMF